MILRIEIPQELIRQDAEIVIKVNNRNNALGYVIENGSEHDAQQIAKEDMNGGPTLGEYVRELTQRLYKNGKIPVCRYIYVHLAQFHEIPERERLAD